LEPCKYDISGAERHESPARRDVSPSQARESPTRDVSQPKVRLRAPMFPVRLLCRAGLGHDIAGVGRRTFHGTWENRQGAAISPALSRLRHHRLVCGASGFCPDVISAL